ncbi:copper resistance protein B [Sphingomonas sp.]|uniref:copper resistance protein B n=1 Tax=Sphingomonas sp. TaxID=28214 RepID=UPI002ED78BB5
MKRLLSAILAASAAAPALAQHSGHDAPPPARDQATDPHAGHRMQAGQPAPGEPADPHAGHDMPAPKPAMPAQQDSHAGHHGHQPGEPQAGPHAGHRMGGVGEAAPPIAPPPAAATSGPPHAADSVYDPGTMARARAELHTSHGGLRTAKFMIDQLELDLRDGHVGYAWEDVQFWYGGDRDKLWVKSQGEGRFGEGVEGAEVQALWSRAIGPFLDLQAGVRYDIRPQPGRGYLVLGVQGLAPYWFEIDAAAFVSEEGDVSARFEAEYDQRITQRLILQPRGGFEVSLQDVPELGAGSGLSTAEAGLRLRYEFVPEFAPYVGVQYERAFGDTADFRRRAGEDRGGWSLVLGVRTWF